MSSSDTPSKKVSPQREDALTDDEHIMDSPSRYEAHLSEMGTPQAGPLTYVNMNNETGPPLPSVESLSLPSQPAENGSMFVQMSPRGEVEVFSAQQRPANPQNGENGQQLQILFAGLQNQLDARFQELQEENRHTMDKMVSILQQESAKRVALEQRFQNQLLLQNEAMVAMELKLLRLEAKLEGKEVAQRNHHQNQNRHNSRTTSSRTNNMEEADSSRRGMAVITSGASLASGVTFPEEEEHSTDDQEPIVHVASQESTPTLGSRQPRIAVGNLESILLNPMIHETTPAGLSTRAVRGETSANSSLATSAATASTFAGSTVITASRHGTDSSLHVRRITAEDQSSTEAASTPRGRAQEEENRTTRSRSQSPLTVHSSSVAASEGTSEASGMTSIPSSAAVALSRSSGMRRAASATAANGDARPLANRLVSFTTELSEILDEAHPYAEGARDSITMPDELDNLSEGVSDTFPSGARLWREEYEARLEALQKRWATE